tara:strand:- start:16938 stop:17969 length:1032 start_codon:yes stop_codon:yes gene_type:complete
MATRDEQKKLAATWSAYDAKVTKATSGMDDSALPEGMKEELAEQEPGAAATTRGVGNADTDGWDVPLLLLSNNEKMIRKGNATIRLGKDRHGHNLSGEGGRGNSHCAAIDICAGHMGWLAKNKNKKGNPLYVDPNFKIDAARVYISQKANVDDYFNLARGAVGSTSYADLRSCVAMKADTVRIIARDNIKLVTRGDQVNSQGGKTSNQYKKVYGIDLIAMNDSTDMQPLVKGDNLLMCLTTLMELIETVTTILENFFQYDQAFKDKVAKHTHMSPFYGSETAPDFKKVLLEGVNQAVSTALNCQVPLMLDLPMDFAALKNDYLEDTGGAVGGKFILSKYNSTN